jgi:outer membrane autotransporter protein
MDSFLSLATSPFAEGRGFAPESPPHAPPLVYKAPVYKAPFGTAPDPRRWGIWAAAYGGETNTTGDASVGTHNSSVGTVGYATGFDYRATPNSVVGFALAGGETRYSLSDGLGSGGSQMLQAGVYSSTHVDAAYLAVAFAYAWHGVSTDRDVAGTDLTAKFSANNVGGRIEGGYRFTIPGVLALPRLGFTPYAAGQAQALRTPSYSESALSGSSTVLAYDVRTTTVARTELGAWFDWIVPDNSGTTLVIRARAAWAHDYWSEPNITAMFAALPGSSFTETVAVPASDFLIASAGAEIGFWNRFSLAAWFHGEFAEHSQRYAGTAQLRYRW